MDPLDVEWDSYPQLPAEPSAAASTLTARRSALWSLGAAVGAGLLLVSLTTSGRTPVEASVPRAPARNPAPEQARANDTREAAAQAALALDPDDREARLKLAKVYLDGQDYMAVWTETQRVLARSPEDPRALSYQAEVRLAMGQPELALGMLKKTLGQDADLLQTYVYLSYVHLRIGQTEEAEAAITAAKRRFPERAAMLSRGFAAMRDVLETAAGVPAREAPGPETGPELEDADRVPSGVRG